MILPQIYGIDTTRGMDQCTLNFFRGSVLAPSRDNRKKNKVLKLELLKVF
jgi:hypothetical protein